MTYSWSGPFGTVSGATASVSLPAGSHVITLTVRDVGGASASATLVVTVLDTDITGDLPLSLRAERSKKGTGRICTIAIECIDASGNVSTKSVTVSVPR